MVATRPTHLLRLGRDVGDILYLKNGASRDQSRPTRSEENEHGTCIIRHINERLAIAGYCIGTGEEGPGNGQWD